MSVSEFVNVAPRVVVNGQRYELGDVGGHVTLLDWLRGTGFTGCKEGCAEGECGACAVMVARPADDGSTRWTAINACLVPAAGLDNQEVITAEGLGDVDALHPVQREMADRGGSQCGYCTPGFICSMASEYYRADRHRDTSATPERAAEAEPHSSGRAAERSLGRNGADPTAAGHAPDHEHGPNGFDLHALSGNLCRCTGYRPIRDAAYALGEPAESDPLFARLRRPAPAPVPTRITSDQGAFARPADLAEALDLLDVTHPVFRERERGERHRHRDPVGERERRAFVLHELQHPRGVGTLGRVDDLDDQPAVRVVEGVDVARALGIAVERAEVLLERREDVITLQIDAAVRQQPLVGRDGPPQVVLVAAGGQPVCRDVLAELDRIGDRRVLRDAQLLQVGRSDPAASGEGPRHRHHAGVEMVVLVPAVVCRVVADVRLHHRDQRRADLDLVRTLGRQQRILADLCHEMTPCLQAGEVRLALLHEGGHRLDVGRGAHEDPERRVLPGARGGDLGLDRRHHQVLGRDQ